MATLGYAGRVGAVVVLALALFIGMWVWFSGSLFQNTITFNVLFNNAQGVQKDVPVEMAGVQIGRVKDVRLSPDGRKAVLQLEVRKKNPIPKASRFTISTSFLGNTGVVVVTPPAAVPREGEPTIRDGETDLVGERNADISSAFARADVLLAQVTQTAKKLDILIGQTTGVVGNRKVQANLQESVANIKAATSNVNAASANGLRLTHQLNALLLADNAQVQGLLRQTRAGSQVALSNITDTTAQIREATRENREKINLIVADLQDTTAAVSGITAQTRDLLKNGGTQEISATLANLKASSDKLAAISDHMEKLTGDPGIQSDLRATVHNIRESSEQSKYLLERLNQLAGTKPRTAAVVVGPGGAVIIPPTGGGKQPPKSNAVPLLLPRVDLLQNLRDDHFRADVDAIVPLASAPGAFARAGIYGFGDTNRLNLQYGRALRPNSPADYRLGLYASKLAVGGDLGLGRDATFSFDLYDPNNYRLDARGVLMLSDELGLVVGADDITRHSGAIVGLQLRRSK